MSIRRESFILGGVTGTLVMYRDLWKIHLARTNDISG